jgi:hypothetical protein
MDIKKSDFLQIIQIGAGSKSSADYFKEMPEHYFDKLLYSAENLLHSSYDEFGFVLNYFEKSYPNGKLKLGELKPEHKKDYYKIVREFMQRISESEGRWITNKKRTIVTMLILMSCDSEFDLYSKTEKLRFASGQFDLYKYGIVGCWADKQLNPIHS